MNPLKPSVPPHRTFGEIAGFLGAAARGESNVLITGLAVATSSVRPGDLFVAVRGANAHGAAYVPAALRAGAVAVLTDDAGATMIDPGIPYLVVPDPRGRLGPLSAWFYDRPADDLTLVGITGTTGKTTVAWLVDAAMRQAWSRSAVLGTLAVGFDGVPVASPRTTLEAPDLQAALAAMREAGIKGCAMEVSSHALALGRVDGLVLDVAVLTNLARDHLDFHRSVDAYHAVKASLFQPDRARHGVVWVGDQPAAQMKPGIPTVRVGWDETADWRAERRGTVMIDGEPAQGFALTGPVSVEAATRLVGEFNLVNAATGLAAAIVAGIDPDVAAAGISALKCVPGRMEPVRGPDPAPLTVVDFAHTPAAINAVLHALRARTAGRLIVVLGAGGGRDRGKRAEMGAAAAGQADVVIVTDDNPRDEDPAAIRRAVLAGVGSGSGAGPGAHVAVQEVPDRAEAIAAALDQAQLGDTVAVLGKGHETGQVVGDRTIDFDDRAVLAEALKEHGPWT
ncbi:MAG: UDP-N-acetylmuramoyl-L-alanyl-D-glutamate--2,6-diaminopimelate ligase [Bifidobacteriaceae bacterium]|jgi:UDP-N-acetylmuramoyl-L-alanyl-D-glutamate--2,6-diaminopimelate ligase|nr:UDP-N-acetylmuramoyl-L-alanyl-D-glutamate--2,6-diaminopimelate ligase [Bifidobacteriaceae bacterium]